MNKGVLGLSLQDVWELRLGSRAAYLFFTSEWFVAEWLRARGVPRLEGHTWRETLFACSFLFLDVTFENVGKNDPKGSVRKSANLRINSGHVRLVKFEHTKGQPQLAVKVQSSMSRRKTYRVTANLATGLMSDSCINRELRLVEDQCSHLRMVPELLYRISRGFERVEFVDKSPSLFPEDEAGMAERFHDIVTLGEDLAYQRLLTRACVKEAKRAGVYELSKHYYIAKEVGLRVHHVTGLPIYVRPRGVTKEYAQVLKKGRRHFFGEVRPEPKKKPVARPNLRGERAPPPPRPTRQHKRDYDPVEEMDALAQAEKLKRKQKKLKKSAEEL
jgi:hypothetical protein